MKLLPLTLSIILSFSASAQVISGIYAGSLENEATHVKQNFELALTEYRGKIWGYSYTTFVRNDSLFYSVKKVTATRVEGRLKIEDEKMLANNFPEKPAKGVHQITWLNLTNEDTLRSFSGSWETNRTKIYHALSGGMAMARNTDSTRSSLLGHLTELRLVPVTETNTNVVASIQAVAPLPTLARKENLIRSIETTADSVTLSLYDNGVVDGDSVTVSANGNVIFDHVRLKATATRLTIPLAPGQNKLILSAESLGTIPPNTGLMSIVAGSTIYQIYFSADFSTNASIILNRKP